MQGRKLLLLLVFLCTLLHVRLKHILSSPISSTITTTLTPIQSTKPTKLSSTTATAATIRQKTILPNPLEIQRPLPFEFIIKRSPFFTSKTYSQEKFLRTSQPLEMVIHIPQPLTPPGTQTTPINVNNPTQPFILSSMQIEILNGDYVEGNLRSGGSWYWSTQEDKDGKHATIRDSHTPPEWETSSKLTIRSSEGSKLQNQPQNHGFDILKYPLSVISKPFQSTLMNNSVTKNNINDTNDINDISNNHIVFATHTNQNNSPHSKKDFISLQDATSGPLYLPDADYDTIESRIWIGSNLPDAPVLSELSHTHVWHRDNMTMNITFQNINDDQLIDVIEMSLPALALINYSKYGCQSHDDVQVCPSLSFRLTLRDTNDYTIATSTTISILGTNTDQFLPKSSLGMNYEQFNFSYIPFNIMNYNSLRPFHGPVELSTGAVLGIIFGTLAGCVVLTLVLVFGIICCIDCCRDAPSSYSSSTTPATATTTAPVVLNNNPEFQEEEWPLDATIDKTSSPNKDTVEMANFNKDGNDDDELQPHPDN